MKPLLDSSRGAVPIKVTALIAAAWAFGMKRVEHCGFPPVARERTRRVIPRAPSSPPERRRYSFDEGIGVAIMLFMLL